MVRAMPTLVCVRTVCCLSNFTLKRVVILHFICNFFHRAPFNWKQQFSTATKTTTKYGKMCTKKNAWHVIIRAMVFTAFTFFFSLSLYFILICFCFVFVFASFFFALWPFAWHSWHCNTHYIVPNVFRIQLEWTLEVDVVFFSLSHRTRNRKSTIPTYVWLLQFTDCVTDEYCKRQPLLTKWTQFVARRLFFNFIANWAIRHHGSVTHTDKFLGEWAVWWNDLIKYAEIKDSIGVGRMKFFFVIFL